jgi:hypothetical protein
MITTDAEIGAAMERAKLLYGEPLAKTAVYIASLKLLMVGLTNGRRLVLPIEDLQGLENAPAKQLQTIEILGRGTGINFPISTRVSMCLRSSKAYMAIVAGCQSWASGAAVPGPRPSESLRGRMVPRVVGQGKWWTPGK